MNNEAKKTKKGEQKYYPPSLFLHNLYHSTKAPFGVSNFSSLEARRAGLCHELPREQARTVF